jgi:hypothetical protein
MVKAHLQQKTFQEATNAASLAIKATTRDAA